MGSHFRPLSYGIADVRQDSSNLSTVSFLWDPTRDTGIFIKVTFIDLQQTGQELDPMRSLSLNLEIIFIAFSNIFSRTNSCYRN